MPTCASPRRRSSSRATVSAAAPRPSRCARASCSPISPSSSCTRARSSAQVTANANEIVPRYTLRGKVESFDAGPRRRGLVRRQRCSPAARRSPSTSTAAGQTPAEMLRGLSGKAALTMAEGARVALDIKALRGRGQGRRRRPAGARWPRDRPVSSRSRPARSSATACSSPSWCRPAPAPLGLAASGRVDLAERTLDLHLAVEAQCRRRQAAQAHGHGGRRGRDGARLLAGALRARRRKPGAPTRRASTSPRRRYS